MKLLDLVKWVDLLVPADEVVAGFHQMLAIYTLQLVHGYCTILKSPAIIASHECPTSMKVCELLYVLVNTIPPS